jgi:hypothetical protein
MPVSRKKSCLQCRRAKARCNLNVICSRCTERGLKCEYIDVYPRTSTSQRVDGAGFRGTGQHGMQASADTLESEDSGTAVHDMGLEPNFRSDELLESSSRQVELENTITHSSGSAQCMDIGLQETPWPNSSTSHSWNANSSETSMYDVPSVEPFVDSCRFAPTGLRIMSRPISPTRDLEICLPELGDPFIASAMGYATIFTRCFDQSVAFIRKPPSIKTSLQTQILVGQISTYPRLLIQGDLPPYIHPSCVLEGRLPENCVVDGVHRCLPESLATCASLTSMFYATGHTNQSRSIVWKLIYQELDKLKQEVCLSLLLRHLRIQKHLTDMFLVPRIQQKHIIECAAIADDVHSPPSTRFGFYIYKRSI